MKDEHRFSTSRVAPRTPRKPFHRVAGALLLGALVAGSARLLADEASSPEAAGPEAAGPVQFSRDIAPILAGACYPCHGPDERTRKARLGLHEEEGIRRVFEPGKLRESEAWRRITSEDEDERMPPPDSRHELEPEEIRLIRRWIEEGAGWQRHWAFVAPTRPPVPHVRRERARAWVRTPIDAFILARLRKEGLAPSGEATREELIRRLSFDLTGLPPTIEAIDRFVNDPAGDAYERLVDRLLASPHYGERMALAWMDLARYGDSSVFHADGPRDMWAWRDWVIKAYNAGKPFDEFTTEQLAGGPLAVRALSRMNSPARRNRGPRARSRFSGSRSMSSCVTFDD